VTLGVRVGQELLEAEVRQYLVELMPLEHAPAHLRLAFHDAGTYDVATGLGGAHGTIRLLDVVRRSENTGWGQHCLELLEMAREQFAGLGWADAIAIGAAAAVEKTGGPIIDVGLGRTDSDVAPPAHKLPGGYEDARLLKRLFQRLGLSVKDLVVLSGAHTLGHIQRRTFTTDTYVFSNSYYVELLEQRGLQPRLNSDDALLEDPELRGLVELYAGDQQRFFDDFAVALRRLTWLGNTRSS
jgi:catalase (peroxidase I)